MEPNLKRLAADLAAHLEALARAYGLKDINLYEFITAPLSPASALEEFLEPYNLSPEDKLAVTTLALGKQCVDCGDVKDWYMVYPDVWNAAGLKDDQCCCKKCLSVRLGRQLTQSDFYPGSEHM